MANLANHPPDSGLHVISVEARDVLYEAVKKIAATHKLKNGETAFFLSLVATAGKHVEKNNEQEK